MSDTLQKNVIYNQLSHSTSHHADEIDLISLFLTLWAQKQLIIAITFISTLFAGIYAFMASEQWTVKAYISSPRIVEIDEYLSLRRAFSRVSNTESNPQNLSHNLFNEFISMASSPNEKMQYLSTTPYFTEQSQGMDERAKQLLLNEITEKQLILSAPDEKKKQPYFTFSMTANDPELAKMLLEDYIKTINDKVIIQDDSEFRHSLAAMIQARKKEKQDIEFKLKTERNNHLAALQQALETAKEAGIKDYYTNSANQGETKIELANSIHRYMLGENYLKAEIQIQKNSPIVYPVRYHEIERELAMLEPLLQQQATAQAYRYQLSPDKYVKKDRPKRAIILILGFLIGIISSVTWVMIRTQFKQRYQTKQYSETNLI